MNGTDGVASYSSCLMIVATMSKAFDSSDSTSLPLGAASLDEHQQLDALCDQFEAAWLDGEQPKLEEYLNRVSEVQRPELLAELWAVELHHRRDALGHPMLDGELRAAHPELADELASLPVDDATRRNQPTVVMRPPTPKNQQIAEQDRSGNRTDSRGLHIRCPHCRYPVELLADDPVENVECESCGSHFSLVDHAEQSSAAQVLETLGRFDLIARLGVGGFGTVWKARDTELDRIVAVKIPRKGQLNAREAEQFLREARAAAQLRHPNIVPVFEVGREAETLFIVSEFVRGVTLSDWMTAGRRSAREVAELCAPVADALHEAHSEGVVHRDLKPANVMLDLQGRPRLMDFGLAKREVGEVTMTMQGQVLGTPAYMSPEQARGEGHWTDRRTDIYSMGIMLFQLLTGELPFRGSTQMQLHQRLTSDAPNPRSLDRTIPKDLATICVKCMEQDPNRRYDTAAELAAELRRFIEGRPIHARPLSVAGQALRWTRRNPVAAIALLLGSILAIGGPISAYSLNLKNRRIEAQLLERDGVLLAKEEQRNELQAAVASLEQKLARLTGKSAAAPIEEWRVDLARSLVAERMKQYEQQAGEMAAGLEKIEVFSSLGQLLAFIGERGDAMVHFQTAFNVVPVTDSAESEAAAIHAGIQLLKLQRHEKQSKAASETLLKLKDRISRLPEGSAVRVIDSLEVRFSETAIANSLAEKKSLLSESQDQRKQLKSDWPDDVAELPQLIERLLD